MTHILYAMQPIPGANFLLIFFPLAILLSIGCFIDRFKGMWWLSILAALSWFLIGFFSISQTEVFYFQRTLTLVWFVVGIAILWTPAWYKKGKDNKTLMEMAAEADEGEEDEEDKLDKEISKQRRAKWRAMRGRGG